MTTETIIFDGEWERLLADGRLARENSVVASKHDELQTYTCGNNAYDEITTENEKIRFSHRVGRLFCWRWNRVFTSSSGAPFTHTSRGTAPTLHRPSRNISVGRTTMTSGKYALGDLAPREVPDVSTSDARSGFEHSPPPPDGSPRNVRYVIFKRAKTNGVNDGDEDSRRGNEKHYPYRNVRLPVARGGPGRERSDCGSLLPGAV